MVDKSNHMHPHTQMTNAIIDRTDDSHSKQLLYFGQDKERIESFITLMKL